MKKISIKKVSKTMKKVFVMFMVFLLMLTGIPANNAEAASSDHKVLIWSPGNTNIKGYSIDPYINLMKTFYQKYGSVNVISGAGNHLTESNIEGIDLLWVFLPNEDFTDSDITLLNNYLKTGARIVLCGENNGWVPEINVRLSAAAAKLGGNFTVLSTNHSNPINGTLSSTTNIKSASELTKGLTGYYFNYAADMSYSGSTQAVIVDNSNIPLVVDQAVGNGRITLFTDLNNWDALLNKWTGKGNNEVLFENLLLDSVANKAKVTAGENPNAGFGGSPSYTVTANKATFAPGSTNKYTFQVEYKVAKGSTSTFDNSQFNDGDATVSSSNGLTYVVHKDASIGGGTGIVSGAGTGDVVVQYTIEAADGKWDSNDSGTFSIGLINASVQDSAGKQISGNTSAGTFEISVASLTAVSGAAISGTPRIGQTLTAGVTPADATVDYQWKVDGVNVGVNQSTYVIQPENLGKTVTVTVTGKGKYTGSVTSNPSGKIEKALTAVSGASIIGTPKVGQTLTVVTSPENAIVDYQWKVDGVNVGTNQRTYVIQPENLGKTVTVTVTGKGDYTGSVTSNPSGKIEKALTAISGASIIGTPKVGQALTVTISPANATADYQWKVDGVNVGTNQSTYVIQPEDLGKTVTVTVTGKGDYTGSVTSNPSGKIEKALTAISGASIVGTPKVGQALTVTISPANATADYQWKVDGVNVGTNQSTYVIQPEDLGKTVTVTVTGKGDYAGSVTSDPTDKVITNAVPLYTVSGTIQDKALQAVSGAAITITDNIDKTKTYTGIADVNGKFSISGVPNGDYKVQASSGNAIGSGTLTVSDSDATVGNIVIASLNPEPVKNIYNTVTGKIQDSSLQAVSGAAITLTNKADGTKIYTGTTDTNGNYSISGVEVGDYTITVTYGDQGETASVVVALGDPITNNITIGSKTPDPTPTPNPTPTPIYIPTTTTEQVVVDVKEGTTDNTASKVAINRTTDASGVKTDSVTYSEDKVNETIENLKKNGNDTARIVIPDSKDEVSETKVTIPDSSVGKLADNNVDLQIDTENAKISISKESVQKAEEAMDNDLYFRLVPIKKEEEKQQVLERAKTEAVFQIAVGDSQATVVGKPMTIETNMPSAPVEITLPINGADIPTDATAREEFLNKLAVYIEHSDGTKELIRGEIVEYKEGIYGIKFTIHKFSTFTIVKADSLLKSNASDITKMASPANVKINGNDLSLSVKNSTKSIKLDLTVSEKASWKLFSDATCTKEIADNTLALMEGTNKAYVKVTAEDGSEKVYNFTVVRAKASNNSNSSSSNSSDSKTDKSKKVIFIATTADYADAYAGKVLAGKVGGKVVRCGYTSKGVKKMVTYVTKNLKKTDTIYILGLGQAVKNDVVSVLKKKGYNHIIRIGGTDKYETAKKISEKLNPKKGTTVVLVNGENKPKDSADISAVCVKNGYPVLYVTTNSLTKYTMEALKDIDPNQIYIVGSNKDISSKVIKELEKKLKISKSKIERIDSSKEIKK